jgi:hypothetical protein
MGLVTEAQSANIEVERPRYIRRLSDKILVAFHQACDQDDLDVARELLSILETMLKRRSYEGNRRRSTDNLVAAHERLWDLRHPNKRVW